MAGVPRQEPVSVRCNAKINLYLKVLGKRLDGFHELETVFHSISLHDVLYAAPTPGDLTVSSDPPGSPTDLTNLALRAASRLLEGSGRGVHIHIDKRIPVGAGLAGGSADAAGALVCVNRLFGLGRTADEIEAIAEDLGSDVKFMLGGGCALGTGRGERLRRLPCLPPLPVVLVMPDITVSTAWAYDSLKMGLTTPGAGLSILLDALERGDVASLCDLLENDFESLVFDRFPIIGDIKAQLVRRGALGALLSGSGSCVYGVFGEEGAARACCEQIAGRGLRVLVCNLTDRGVGTP